MRFEASEAIRKMPPKHSWKKTHRVLLEKLQVAKKPLAYCIGSLRVGLFQNSQAVARLFCPEIG